jgi:murein hydrolase activator
MKYIWLLFVIFFSFSFGLKGQTKAELEEKRRKTLQEIAYVDDLLVTTKKKKTESMNAVKIIARKLDLRESVITDMREEISLINRRIDLNTLAINMMEDDLIIIKTDYRKAVLSSYRFRKSNPELVYILSAQDFNQGYKRLKYLQQLAKFRRKETEILVELKKQIESSKRRLENDLGRIYELKIKEEQQKSLLQGEQEKRKSMVKSLSNKERKLKKELEDKKLLAKRIENEISRIIEEEKKRSIKLENAPEERLIGESFSENKGRLPWPVEKGIITSHFGVQKHPVLKYLTENNIGIEITSSGRVNVRNIFQGEVARVFPIQGENMTVIVRHGKYLTVYANIVNVRVKKGDKVMTKESIGDVYSDPEDNFNCVLKFMIYETNTKYIDPEVWISKKQ